MDALLASVHPLAVLLAALSGFVLGGLWYGPLYGKAWLRESGMTEERAKAANKPRLFGTVFVLNLIITASLALFIGPSGTWSSGLFAGFMAGFTFVAMALGVSYLFEQKSLTLWLINAGYQVLFFSVAGTILGAWHR